MSIFSLVLGIIDLVYYVYYLSGAIPGTTGEFIELMLGYNGCCAGFTSKNSKDLWTKNKS